MTKNTLAHLIIPAIFITISVMLTGFAQAETIPLMTKEQLRSLLGENDVTILDVRAGRDWKSSEFKITGAERVAPASDNQWADKFNKNKTYVFYCA